VRCITTTSVSDQLVSYILVEPLYSFHYPACLPSIRCIARYALGASYVWILLTSLFYLVSVTLLS